MFFVRRYNYLTSLLLLVAAVMGCQPHAVTVNKYPAASDAPDAVRAKVIFLAGPDSHGEGEHEHRAGAELLSVVLREQQPGFETINVYGGWPEDESIFVNVDAVVIYCDGGADHLIDEHLTVFNHLLDQGVGVIAVHYALEVSKDSLSAKAMLRAIGGYFETHWSVNPFWEARYTSLPNHAITQGVPPFTLFDEWYFNMRFQPDGVTPILSAVAPASTMDRWNGSRSGNDTVRKIVAEGVPQITAWAYERDGGGRGFGYTGGHVHDNWQDNNARQLVLNAISWVIEGKKKINRIRREPR
jgi:type 1 glutamine amidotransferase